MLDKVFIHELTAFASIGAYDWEHTIKQRLVFDIELYWDFSKAVETDDVQYCLKLCRSLRANFTFRGRKTFQTG